MKPTKNYVLVVAAGEESKTTAGGIILQTKVETGSEPGFVLAVGPDEYTIKPKDKVALDWGKGMPITVKGEKAILVCADFIYGIY
jgi:co-chaperonin GroES (HSP10)|tara:strand:+ start:2294 stop:2548 length:255 start_codon:yes stop_codon:yes gene_type:complete